MSVDRPEMVEYQADARGGLSRKISPHLIQANQVYGATNTVTHRGGFRKTSGHSMALTQVPATAAGVSCARAYDLVSGNFTVASYSNGAMYRLSGARMAAVSSATGLSSTKRLSFALANRILYFADGAKFLGWSGNRATAAFTATSPAAGSGYPRFVLFHQESNRMFAGRTAAAPQRMYYSNVNAFTTWDTNDWIDIPESRIGDKIMGFDRLMGNLVIFGERTVSVLSGRVPSDFQLRTLEWEHGCKAPFSIVSFGQYIIYVSSDGIYKFDGSGSAIKLTDAIEDIFNDIDISNESGPVAMRNREGYYVLSYHSLASGGASITNNREIVVLPPIPEAPYWHFEGPNDRGFSGYARYVGGSDTNQTYALTAAVDGKLFKLDSGKDYDGTGADMQITTRQYDFKAPFTRKEFLGFEIHAEAGGDYGLEIEYKIDNDTNWRMMDSVSLQNSGSQYGAISGEIVNRQRVIHPMFFDPELPVIGNYIQFRIRQRGANGKYQPVNILGWKLTAKSWAKGKER